jgi:hypothetical protein
MPYTYPGQAFDNTLLALKGYYRDQALDIDGVIGSNVNLGSAALPVVSGMCVHLVASITNDAPYGNGPAKMVFEMGCGPLHGIPMFLWPNVADFDVSNVQVPAGVPAYGSASVAPNAISSMPGYGGTTGEVHALVAVGAYELETTEFDAAQTYVPGQVLRAVTSNTNTNGGRLTNQRNSGGGAPGYNSNGLNEFVGNSATIANWDTIVGVVSRGTYTNANRKNILAFHPVYLPGNR